MAVRTSVHIWLLRPESIHSFHGEWARVREIRQVTNAPVLVHNTASRPRL